MNLTIVGAGIMGVTLATLARELSPSLEITLIERLPGPGLSNSSVFNNAGTGHEANCELNYTPVDGEDLSVHKALKIHSQFNVAKQFWAYLVKKGIIEDPSTFIHPTKHCTIVTEEGINFLKLRFKELSNHHFFEDMQYTEAFDEIKSWMPYVMENRATTERMAATKIDTGTDVNFQVLTEKMAAYLAQQEGVTIHYNTQVKRIHKRPTGRWLIEAQKGNDELKLRTDVLFVGAGGGAFPLLKQSRIPDRKRFAGFPVGGRFLLAPIDEAAAKHYNAKTYGKADVGAPPMSVPHLDLRAANGEHYLLFGPFATFMPRLEKDRGIVEYIRSMRLHDIPGLFNVALKHFPLVKYLVTQTLTSKDGMYDELERFAPGIRQQFDWRVIQAGQRVQIIKDGDLQMGTEIVISDDRSFGTLLGASPGASVSPEIMLRCLEKLMPTIINQPQCQDKLNEIFAVHDLDALQNDASLYRNTRDKVNKALKISG